MDKELFEFLSVHFQTIFSTKKKKAFLHWLEHYIGSDQSIHYEKGLFKRQQASKLLVVSYTADEMCWFGRKFLTLPEMNRFFQKVKLFKIGCLLLSVMLLFLTYHWFQMGAYWLTALCGGLMLISYILAIGIPKKYNFSKIATLTTAIEIFQKDASCDLLLVEENPLHIKAQKNMYQEVFLFGDLYGTQALYAKKLTGTSFFISSGKIENQEAAFFHSCRHKNIHLPQKWYTSLAVIKEAAAIK